MAVPFALPEDELGNLMLAVIFLLSDSRVRGLCGEDLQACMEQLVRLLVAHLQRRAHSEEYDDHLRESLFMLHYCLTQFRPVLSRRRSNFDSFCDDCKSKSLHEDFPTEDCSQVGCVPPKIADDETISKEGLQEKVEFVRKESLWPWLVPKVKRTFWTAVPLICLVGWHLFQINYSM